MPPDGLPSLRRSLNAAIAWRVVAELVRRHQPRFGLRVLETHPGGGQYDCLSLTMASPDGAHRVHLAAFNLGSGRVTVFNPVGTDGGVEHWRDDFFAEFSVRSDDPKAGVDRTEALLGLPRLRTLPPVGTAARCLRILASVMETQAFAREPLRAESAWHDSSGMEGSYVAGWLATVFPALAGKAAADTEGVSQARIAARVWKVGRVAIDIASGTAVKVAQPDRTTLLLHADERTAVEWVLAAARA